MAQFTVHAVSDQVREVRLGGDDFKAYRMHLRDAGGQIVQSVEWLRKASSPGPQKGEQLEGDVVEQGQYGLKFKAAKKAFGGGGGRRDPQESAHIRRQNAQAQALRWFELLSTRGELTTPSLLQLQEAINWFYTDSGQAKP